MKTRLAWLAAHLTLLAIAAAGFYLLVYNLHAWRGEVAEARLPVRAVQTARASKWQTQLIPPGPAGECQPVAEAVLSAKERDRLDRDYGRGKYSGQPAAPTAPPAGAAEVTQPSVAGGEIGPPSAFKRAVEEAASHILGEFVVPPMKRGGAARADLMPDGRLELTFRANPPRFLDLRPTWGGGVWLDALKPAERFGGYLLWEPLTVRERWHLRVTPGLEWREDAAAKPRIPIALELRVP